MSRFLTLIPLLAAQKILKQSAKPGYQVETIPVIKSSGYISHVPVFSRLTIPLSAVSDRDGYAITSGETLDATEGHPVILDTFAPVHTGSPIPEDFDAVIMQEDARTDEEGHLLIGKPARPGQHIMKTGSEIRAGKMIIPAGHLITPEDIGAMVGYGVITIQVRTITVGLIPTGDELKEPCTAPGPGEVIASNCLMIAAMFQNLGIQSRQYPIVPDNQEKLKTVIEDAVRDCHFVIISGGSATGKRDHSSHVLNSIGTILYHGVSIRPGRTTLAALVEEVPVFGLPGTPVGARTVVRELIIPWLKECGYPVLNGPMVQAVLAESVPSELGTDDFVPVVVGNVRGKYRAVMVPRGGGQLSSVKSNGTLHIARNSEGLKQEKECFVNMNRHLPHPDHILLFSGIADPILDFLDQYLRTLQMGLYCKQTKHEATLLTMQNRNFHGGIIKRSQKVGENGYHCDTSFLFERSHVITIAEREYILAARVFPESGTVQQYTCPALPADSFLKQIMDSFIEKCEIKKERITYPEQVSSSEDEVVRRVIHGEFDFGPCSGYLGSEYDLFGPVIGRESIELIIREEDVETEQMVRLRNILSSDEWKDIVSEIPGYSSVRSGQCTLLSRDEMENGT